MGGLCEECLREFQSTPSARRATGAYWLKYTFVTDFNPRPPRGGRRLRWYIRYEEQYPFQSTPSARRATCLHQCRHRAGRISIHALREEGDGVDVPLQELRPISIHALREEGDKTTLPYDTIQMDFNPRPPRGGRRGLLPASTMQGQISIHALREEGDRSFSASISNWRYFNPRPPRGGRQQKRRKNPPRLFHYTHLCTI